MKIYIVTSGQYSDYGIDKVFLSKEKAQLYIDIHKASARYYGGYHIEEYETYDENIQGLNEINENGGT